MKYKGQINYLKMTSKSLDSPLLKDENKKVIGGGTEIALILLRFLKDERLFIFLTGNP
jgi:hypothetical protein